MDDSIAKLWTKFKGEIDTAPGTLDRYSHDASIFHIRPEAIVYPKDADDVTTLVEIANAGRKIGIECSLTARSGGTDMTGGAIGNSFIVDFTRYFKKIGSVLNGHISTEPGVYYRDFEKVTLAKGFIMPSYPASREICTVGGMVANNAGGEKTLSYGKTAQYVQEVGMVLSDGTQCVFHPLTKPELTKKLKLETREGEIYRQMHKLFTENQELLENARPKVSKNSSGYALWDMEDEKTGKFNLAPVIVGSQGTLGLITHITFGLVRPKPYTQLLVAFLKDFRTLGDITHEVMAFQPESFESYDKHTFTLALKVFPSLLRRLKGNILKLGFQFLPELWAVLTGGVPKLVLLAEFSGDTPEEAEDKAFAVKEHLDILGVRSRLARSPAEAEKYWVIRRESFNLLRHHVKGLKAAPIIEDIIVPPEKMPEFLPKLYQILDRYHFVYTIAGHVGDGNLHIIPLMDFSRPDLKDTITRLADEVYTLTLEYGGSLSAEHNDGLIRAPYLATMYGREVYQLFEETKRIFDPDNIFNPGKKVGASFNQVLQYLNTESKKR